MPALWEQVCWFACGIHQDNLEHTPIGYTDVVCIAQVAGERWWGRGQKNTHHYGTRHWGFHTTRAVDMCNFGAGVQHCGCYWMRLGVRGCVAGCLMEVG